MNLDRYEKIDGREALKRLADGEKIIRETGSPYFISDEGRFVCDNAAIYRPHVTDLTLDEILNECTWYIKKPFDVRQAMLDRPYEWVAAYPNHEGKWFKIGFVSASMSAVVEEFEWEGPPFWRHDRARPHLLDNCIPIEDVPEEATR